MGAIGARANCRRFAPIRQRPQRRHRHRNNHFRGTLWDCNRLRERLFHGAALEDAGRKYGRPSFRFGMEAAYVLLLPIALFYAFRIAPNTNFGALLEIEWVILGHIRAPEHAQHEPGSTTELEIVGCLRQVAMGEPGDQAIARAESEVAALELRQLRIPRQVVAFVRAQYVGREEFAAADTCGAGSIGTTTVSGKICSMARL